MTASRNNRFRVICVCAIALMVVAFTCFLPIWPLVVVELTVVALFDPDCSIIDTSCPRVGIGGYALVWALLLGLTALAGVLVRRWLRAGQR